MRKSVLTGMMLAALAVAGVAVARPAMAFRMPKPDAEGAGLAMIDTSRAKPVLVAVTLFAPADMGNV